ncbi:MAG: protein kinase [Bacteroidales bacterium]|nr:protein kinase [Bacteroidales bacterium]
MSSELQRGIKLCGNKYTIVRKLGQGSFGITYQATMRTTLTGPLGSFDSGIADVAIKEFFMSDFNSRSYDGSNVEGTQGTLFQNYRRKFRREAENLSRMDHPSIVKVLDLFDENGTTYYVMQYIDGESLDNYIGRAPNGHLPEVEAVSILKQIGSALQYMHENLMLHLDVKPGNVMRRSDGTVVLIDFGLSKQYDADGEPESSSTLGNGTRGYAPIEQSGYVQDGTFPATLDIYALGGTLFKMLCGQRPPDASELITPDAFPVSRFRKLEVSDATISAMRKAMALNKNDRFQSVNDFMDALGSFYGMGNEKTELYNSERIGQVTYYPEEGKQQLDIQPDNPKSSKSWILYALVTGIVVFVVSFVISRGFSGGKKTADLEQSKETADSVQAEVRPEDTETSSRVIPAGYVDLGLPSGTLWKDENENGFYNYAGAMRKFGSRMPTKEQMDELVSMCKWTWNGNGYNVRGPNGSSIVLPASGFRYETGEVDQVGNEGDYWTSTPHNSGEAWALVIDPGPPSELLSGVLVFKAPRIMGLSVRLVQK